MSILKPINRYLQKFAFTKREFNALLFLLFLLLALSVAPYILRSYEVAPLVPAEKLAIEKLQFQEEQRIKSYKRFAFKKADRNYPAPEHFTFDPNTATADDWQKMGFSPKQAAIIVNYTNKGGHFYRPEDLKKMFVVSDQKYQELAPFIQIRLKATEIHKSFAGETKMMVDLNSADSATLDGLRGIGPAFARRILKYRQRLGGFYKMEQLKEVWQLDSALYETLVPQLTLTNSGLKKININTVTFETLKNHPYLSYRQMNAIINYRKQHGNYQNENDLAKVVLLDKATIAKILPYLEF